MRNRVDVEIDKNALKNVVQDAFEKEAFSGDLSYPCPECGKDIPITGPTNECECGFVLNVELGQVEL